MDKAALEADMTKTLDTIINVLSKQTDAIFEKRIRPGAWTIGQLAWHVVKASRDMSNAPTRKSNRPFNKYVGEIEDVFLNDNVRLTAPEALIPEDRIYTVGEVVKALRDNKEAALRVIREKDLTEQVIDNELPGWGYLTRYEWAKLMVYHVTRHTKQLVGYLR
ncbi:MAG TPA: DinB family protein [Chryseolinea sp.]|nr:DinB family protein [Chryseolinea sp.]